jgi:signal transduction histidine kinase
MNWACAFPVGHATPTGFGLGHQGKPYAPTPVKSLRLRGHHRLRESSETTRLFLVALSARQPGPAETIQTSTDTQRMFSLLAKVRIGFGLALLALAIISVVSYWSTSRFVELVRLRRQTYAGLYSLDATLSIMKDAETGQRGYLLTSDEKYLGPYASAVTALDAELKQLRATYADSPKRREHLDALEALCAAKRAELAETIQLRQNLGLEAALEVVRSDKGIRIMDKLRAEVGAIRADALEALAQRDQMVATAADITLYTVTLGSAVAIVIVILAFVAITRDVVGRRRAEDALRQSHQDLALRVDERTAELQQANETMRGEIAERKAAQAAQQKSEKLVIAASAKLGEVNRDLVLKSQENEMFVYSVSHDLRSPLVNLQGFSQELASVTHHVRDILSQPELPLQLRERGLALVDNDMTQSIGFIQSAVLRLSRIIDALLRLSRAGRVEYESKLVDVESTVGAILASVAGTIDEKGAQITVASLPAIWGDPTAVEQIFANLISNALNYLDPKRSGTIEIGCTDFEHALSSDDGRDFHTYYVRDNGLGIPEAYRGKLFQAFQRLHPLAAKGEGIGLTLIRRMVERHGGKIWCESVAGEGSTFFVTLPARTTGKENTQIEELSEKERGYENDCTATGYLARGR